MKYVSFSALFFLVACDAASPRVGSPHWSKDVCEHCRMALSVKAHAAQLVGPGARVAYFDDLGCAVAEQASRPELAESVLYVLEPGSDEVWITAEKALFADGVETPMNFGIAPATNGALTIERARVLLLERTRESARHRHAHGPHEGSH